MTLGYVVNRLHAAFRVLNQRDGFRDVLLAEVDLGRDANTASAVAGQLAGRVWGYEGIPGNWRSIL